MPPDMAVSMRHTKLKAEEAALIAGEVTKPSWESRNEGIHERVSFEDTIWGFDLAGGAYYRTPLRVTFVKPDSRAEKAGIRPGDRLLRINGVETSSLTIQEAHDIIIKADMHLQLNVTAPEDETDAYYCYEDPIIDEYEAEQERLRAEEAARRQSVHARVSSYWSLQWPWVSKRKIIWRESNCFMVPSKYEEKHRDKFPVQPSQRREDNLVLDSVKNSRRRTPPKFVRSKSYEGVTIDENAPESELDEADNDNDSKINSNGPENGRHEVSVRNGEVVDVDDSDVEQNSVIENNHVNYNNDDSLHTEVDDNSDMETMGEGLVDENSDVNIEDINEGNENIQDDTNDTDLQYGYEEPNDLQENSNISNKDYEILDETLNERDLISKLEEDDVIERVLNENGQDVDDSEHTNER